MTEPAAAPTPASLVRTADHHHPEVPGAWVREIILDNHPQRNKISLEMIVALETAMTTAADAGARAILLRGEGTVFSSGADLSGDVYAGGFFAALTRMLGVIQTLPVAVVGWINGPAIGAGSQLAMACDLRVVDPSAYFTVPVTDIGIALDDITVRSLEALVGGAIARTMLLTGASLSADDAHSCGFAAAVGGHDTALDLALLMATKAPLTVRTIKYQLSHHSQSPRSAAEIAAAAQQAWDSADLREAQAARAQRRRPQFHGR